MPQVQLPLFPAGTTHLNDDLAFECHDGQVTYFNGHLPVFTHRQDDLEAFRLFTSQLAREWMSAQPENDGVYYADGHVRVYHGKLAELPRHYVARQKLCLRGTCLSNGLWVREIRQREESGHQVSVLATDYRSELRPIAVRLFARWTQANFFKYMREHYAIDRLVEHGTEPLPETTLVVNPAWRKLDSQIRREQALRERDHAAFGALSLSAISATLNRLEAGGV